MGSQYIPPPEQNVVNVGDEISINALNGIAQANPAITSTNPVATNNSVATAVSGKANSIHSHVINDVTGLQTALNGKADLSGATFTGKITSPPVGTNAGLNIGASAVTPTTLANGDIWIGDNLNFRNQAGASRSCAMLNTANTISASTTVNPIVTINQLGSTAGVGALVVTNTAPANAVRITQTGNGNALVVEDEASPDATPFVIGADGRVGIHGNPAVSTSHKLAIYNGHIVFSAGWGLAFGDGTTQTTGASPAAITSLAKQHYDKEYLAQNLAGSVTSVVWDGSQSHVNVSLGEVGIAKANDVGPQQVYVYANSGPASGGVAATSFTGSQFNFPVDITNGGAASYIQFGIGSTNQIMYAVTFTL